MSTCRTCSGGMSEKDKEYVNCQHCRKKSGQARKRRRLRRTQKTPTLPKALSSQAHAYHRCDHDILEETVCLSCEVVCTCCGEGLGTACGTTSTLYCQCCDDDNTCELVVGWGYQCLECKHTIRYCHSCGECKMCSRTGIVYTCCECDSQLCEECTQCVGENEGTLHDYCEDCVPKR
jgi:hypothetical protein